MILMPDVTVCVGACDFLRELVRLDDNASDFGSDLGARQHASFASGWLGIRDRRGGFLCLESLQLSAVQQSTQCMLGTAKSRCELKGVRHFTPSAALASRIRRVAAGTGPPGLRAMHELDIFEAIAQRCCPGSSGRRGACVAGSAGCVCRVTR